MARALSKPAALHISIDVTSAEKRAITRRARDARLSTVEYVRQRALDDTEERLLSLVTKELSDSVKQAKASVDSGLSAWAEYAKEKKGIQRKARASVDRKKIAAFANVFLKRPQ